MAENDSWTIHEGDCVDVMRSLPECSVDAVITDPPYGMAFQSAWRIEAERFSPIINDKELFLDWIAEAYRVTRDGGSILCFCPWMTAEAFREEIERVGYRVRSQIVWDRGVHGLGDLKAMFAPQHDLIWFATKGDGFEFPNGRPTSVIRSQRVSPEQLTHPSEKPIHLMSTLVRAVTRENAVVLDPFVGSGTTVMAAERLGRRGIGIELDPTYAALAKRRLGEVQLTLC